MRTTHTLPYRESPWVSPGQRPSLDRDPLGQRPLDRDPPVNKITDRCKNITFPQLVGGKYIISIQLDILILCQIVETILDLHVWLVKNFRSWFSIKILARLPIFIMRLCIWNACFIQKQQEKYKYLAELTKKCIINCVFDRWLSKLNIIENMRYVD